MESFLDEQEFNRGVFSTCCNKKKLAENQNRLRTECLAPLSLLVSIRGHWCVTWTEHVPCRTCHRAADADAESFRILFDAARFNLSASPLRGLCVTGSGQRQMGNADVLLLFPGNT